MYNVVLYFQAVANIYSHTHIIPGFQRSAPKWSMQERYQRRPPSTIVHNLPVSSTLARLALSLSHKRPQHPPRLLPTQRHPPCRMSHPQASPMLNPLQRSNALLQVAPATALPLEPYRLTATTPLGMSQPTIRTRHGWLCLEEQSNVDVRDIEFVD